MKKETATFHACVNYLCLQVREADLIRFLEVYGFFPGFIPRIDITPDNSLWVGAWWIGFLGAGAGSLLISVPILGYPHRLPGT